MKTFKDTTLWLMIIGSLNWGLVGIAEFNLVHALLGVNTPLTKIVYILVGFSGLFHIVVWIGKLLNKAGENLPKI